MSTKTLAATTRTGQPRCQNTTSSGRQCLLAVHKDEVTHKYVDRSRVHKPLSEVLPAGFTIKATEVKPGQGLTKGGERKDTRPRDADQKRTDTDARLNYEKNHKAGHTTATDFQTVILTEYIVPPRAVDTVLDYLRRAAGTGGTVRGSQFRYRKGVHASGNVVLHWAFLDKAPKAETTPESS